MAEWKIDSITAGFLGSVALFGMMFGAILFGSLSDKLERYGFSRKKLINFASVYSVVLLCFVAMRVIRKVLEYLDF
ncbi:MAG: hypothetical protein GAK29_00399 [Acinetobacter bereziniae]|uniref:Uncharacterized protein n=1 Tax=Acinetobacter bereziniae TaxID=106648 RepID=A0A833PJL3_ACIBZ|nr:MAG: hypothetical protein GAK29_00399 [Acinetobacter bereziniae]